ncbi:MAG: DNA topoisomerase, partial [Kofleriaceae bacterium]
MQLIVAEKPSVARDLARVLGVRPAGAHWFEGDGRVITWCIGHLVELDEPAAYDARWRAWRLDSLPMLPSEFRLRAARHAVPQLRAVTRLLADRRFSSVVNACDAGREGELIFRYLYQFAGGGPPVLRLWISSLTDEAIRRGFAALRPGRQLDALGDAARSRSEADWLVGMNATRALTVRGRSAGHTALYSIGRVQTPTLAMLVGREQAIQAFVPRPYWEVRAELTTADGQRFSAGWRHRGAARLASAGLADALVARDRALGAAAHPLGPRVEQIRARTVREPAPQLFDLTSLQRTANRRFGFSAARTLEIAQALYERHKLLTYPRTDARHLSSDMVPELPGLFAALAELPDYAPFARELVAHPPRPGRRVVDDAKVGDHHAIIPTGHTGRFGALDRDERRLFDLVVRRFLGAFYPDAEIAVTEVWIRVGAATGMGPSAPGAATAMGPSSPGAATGMGPSSPGAATGTGPSSPGAERARGGTGAGDEPLVLEALPALPDRYFVRGRVRIAAGWQAVAGIEAADAARERPARGERGEHGERGEPDGGPEAASVLPPLVEGQALDGAFAPVAKQTTPPPRYTEATLLGAMESAGKSIDDEALRSAMKDSGLGTPATRASIIETLLDRGYVVRARQHLVPTALGIGLIEALPVASLGSPELTGAWEARLARIARGEESRAAFMADIARFVEEIVAAIRAWTPPAAPASQPPLGDGAGAFAPRGRRGRARRVGGTRRARAGSAQASAGSAQASERRAGASRRSRSAEGEGAAAPRSATRRRGNRSRAASNERPAARLAPTERVPSREDTADRRSARADGERANRGEWRAPERVVRGESWRAPQDSERGSTSRAPEDGDLGRTAGRAFGDGERAESRRSSTGSERAESRRSSTGSERAESRHAPAGSERADRGVDLAAWRPAGELPDRALALALSEAALAASRGSETASAGSRIEVLPSEPRAASHDTAPRGGGAAAKGAAAKGATAKGVAAKGAVAKGAVAKGVVAKGAVR